MTRLQDEVLVALVYEVFEGSRTGCAAQEDRWFTLLDLLRALGYDPLSVSPEILAGVERALVTVGATCSAVVSRPYRGWSAPSSIGRCVNDLEI